MLDYSNLYKLEMLKFKTKQEISVEDSLTH